MTGLVDTHCHIQSAGSSSGERGTRELWAKDEQLTPDLLVANAKEYGVDNLICVGCDVTDSKLAVEFVKEYDNCWASIGIHPHEAQHFTDNHDALVELAALAEDEKVVAVGECGLDFYYNHSPVEDQEKILRVQIELAVQQNLPLIFHVREAFENFWPIINEYQNIRGVLHSYTDNVENLEKALACGLYIGVNGIATFAKSTSQQQVYKNIPLKNLLLETDAPFLTPSPYRGTVNQPKHIRTIADFLSELRQESVENIADATTQNAQKLFGGLA